MAREGEVLGGRYELVRRLGAGGMGVVWLARDDRLERLVAVKRLHLEGEQGEALRRLRREARIGARLSHPNLVAVFDALPDAEGLVVVMEYVEGETLSAALRRGPLAPDRALAVLRDVAAGLDHAHAQGTIHRDVKPANVLLGPRGEAKLADLGIAAAAGATRITRSDALVGTPAYVAPELLEGGEATPASDVYALAAVAFEVLSGRRAHEGATPLDVVRRALDQPPPDLAALGAGPPAAAAAVRHGMARDPAARPASAAAFVQELAHAFEPEPEPEPEREEPAPRAVPRRPRPAPPPSPAPAPSRKRSRRGPRLAALAALLAGVGAAVALVLALDPGEEEGAGRASTATTARPPQRSRPSPARPATLGPAGTVRAFYERAARDDYEGAWTLAGARVRRQLESFDAFRRQFSTLESIRFESLAETGRSGGGATVSLRTEARHTTRTDRCSGTVRTARADGRWRLDALGISCTPG